MYKVCCISVRRMWQYPIGEENVTGDPMFSDYFLWKGWDHIYGFRVKEEGVSILSDYDCIVLPDPSPTWGGPQWSLYREILDNCKNSKVVAQANHNPKVMENMFIYSDEWFQCIDEFDAIIVNTYENVEYLSTVCNVPLFVVPLPVSLKKIQFREDCEKDGLILLHYGGCPGMGPSYNTIAALAKDYGQDVTMITRDTEWIREIQELIYKGEDPPIKYVDWITPHSEFIRFLSRFKLGVFLNPVIHTGRVVVDCAIAGTPCVIYGANSTIRSLYPLTNVPSYGIGAVEIGRRLMEDVQFYRNVANIAETSLHQFSYDYVDRIMEHVLEKVIGEIDDED